MDAMGSVIAFGGRIMGDGQPKYLNSSENALFHKSNVLFGLDKAKANMTSSGTAIVVEGYTDVIAMHEAGINYAVATLGTALTRSHIRVLNQHAKNKIVYLFDGDEAGQRAAERALNFIDQMQRPEIYSKQAELVALTLPDNMDPKEFIDAKGADELTKLLAQAKPLLQYGIERKLKNYDLSVPGNKSRAASAALKVLAPIKESLLAKEYCTMIADATGMRTEDLISELSKLKKPGEYEETPEPEIEAPVSKSSKVSRLENELLCVFAKHPDKIKTITGEDFSYVWSVPTHKKLYEYMVSVLSENPSINAAELVMKIHQKNAKTANMLTRISQMYDIKSKPEQHGKYLLLLLKVEEISSKIQTSKAELNNMPDGEDKDKAYVAINELVKAQKDLRNQANEMI